MRYMSPIVGNYFDGSISYDEDISPASRRFVATHVFLNPRKTDTCVSLEAVIFIMSGGVSRCTQPPPTAAYN